MGSCVCQHLLLCCDPPWREASLPSSLTLPDKESQRAGHKTDSYAIQASPLHPAPQSPHPTNGDNALPTVPREAPLQGQAQWPGHAHGTYLMASHMSSPIFTQLRACVGRDTGRPDTQ